MSWAKKHMLKKGAFGIDANYSRSVSKIASGIRRLVDIYEDEEKTKEEIIKDITERI